MLSRQGDVWEGKGAGSREEKGERIDGTMEAFEGVELKSYK